MNALTVVHIALPLLLGLACYTELRFRKIPNLFTVSGIIYGIGANTILFGWSGLIASGEGLLLGGGVFLPFCLMGVLGGGDMKLMAACGAIIGYPLAVTALCYTCLAGGVIALVMMAWQGKTLSTLASCFKILFGLRNQTEKRSSGLKKEITLPYGLAITIGTLTALVVSAGVNN